MVACIKGRLCGYVCVCVCPLLPQWRGTHVDRSAMKAARKILEKCMPAGQDLAPLVNISKNPHMKEFCGILILPLTRVQVICTFWGWYLVVSFEPYLHQAALSLNLSPSATQISPKAPTVCSRRDPAWRALDTASCYVALAPAPCFCKGQTLRNKTLLLI